MNEVGRDMLFLSLVVWIAVAASVIAMVVYTGVTGVVFAFIVLVVAVTSWSRVVRDSNRKSNEHGNDELLNEIKELTQEIKELKKSLEE
ncbi:MAG: hypothetical protein JRM84_02695 [Nitrososphaerota archaeon]|jgi:membrane protein implicated in regulation of membrane protease activity|nr:hypothetical protein [Nitrososphaerota archaeon]MDG6932165.1 hypothetical protein [Nitrososphaerota archaeon]MDG6943910.1 hypothetical protein [Nitrososphaerota archaeon]